MDWNYIGALQDTWQLSTIKTCLENFTQDSAGLSLPSLQHDDRKPRPDPGVDIGEKDVSVVIVIDVVVVCDEDVVVDL